MFFRRKSDANHGKKAGTGTTGQAGGIRFRTFEARELRAAGDESEPVLEGYAVVWDSPSVDMGGITEVVRRGAFTESLREGGQMAFWSHRMDQPLGSSMNETLELTEDDTGLFMRLRPNMDTSWGRDSYASIARGDVRHMSFGFDPVEDSLDHDQRLLTLIRADLWEVSPVAFPAYPSTSVQARDRVIVLESEKPVSAEARANLLAEVRESVPCAGVLWLPVGVHARGLRFDETAPSSDRAEPLEGDGGAPGDDDGALEELRASLAKRADLALLSVRARGITV